MGTGMGLPVRPSGGRSCSGSSRCAKRGDWPTGEAAAGREVACSRSVLQHKQSNQSLSLTGCAALWHRSNTCSR